MRKRVHIWLQVVLALGCLSSASLAGASDKPHPIPKPVDVSPAHGIVAPGDAAEASTAAPAARERGSEYGTPVREFDHSGQFGKDKYLSEVSKPKLYDAYGSSIFSRLLFGCLLLSLLLALGWVWWRKREAARGQETTPNTGRIAMFWLGPHVLMGLWLAFVPDTVSFTANQVVLLLHVVLALATLPIVVGYSVHHIRKTWGALTGPGHAGTLGKHGSTLAVLGALVSGVVVLWYGRGMPAGTVHLWFGLSCGVALVLHLKSLSLHELTLGVVATLVGVGAVAALTAWVAPRQAWDPDKPDFAYTVRPLELYDDAEWCGSCHTEFYNEWKRSVHGTTFNGHAVQHEQRPLQEQGYFTFGLADVGKIVHGERTARGSPGDPPAMFATCSHCHTPSLYYSDATEGPFGARPPVSDGITCSFCHTLRGVRDGGDTLDFAFGPGDKKNPQNLILAKAFPVAPFYVSAPETVRRYLGQNSRDRFARWVGDKLINWWPEMHRRDYHSKFLDTASVCQGCHGMGADATIHGTFIDWRESRFGKAAPEDIVTCQDCHMANEMTGKPLSEPGRHVTWGPVRPRRTTHLFTGGNADWSARYADEATAENQRRWNRKSIEVEVMEADVQSDSVAVTVQVRTPLIGHGFPSMETVMRFAWVEVQALDEAGATLARTRRRHGGNFSPDRMFKEVTSDNPEPPSPLIYRNARWPEDGSENTLIPADGKRDFSVRLPIPAGKGKVAKLAAQVYNSWDKVPVARTEAPVSAGKKQNL